MSKIEWTDETWNPVAGCSIVGPECQNCYAMRMAARLELMGNRNYRGLTKKGKSGKAVWTGKIVINRETLLKPLSWKESRRVFVNSMSDLFHEDLPGPIIKEVLDVIEKCPQHTFQVLTKRAPRMRQVMQHWCAYPYPNLWLGVSVGIQSEIGRVDELLKTPAAVRFVSYEPALELVKFKAEHFGMWQESNRPYRSYPVAKTTGAPKIDWLIVGGESGPGARPFDLAWARSAIAQCKAAKVACFVKQLGANLSDADLNECQRESGKSVHDRKGGDPSEWPADLRVREWPDAAEVPV